MQRTKEWWSQEELSFMAECEASIPLHITNCNQLLQPYFPHRTIERVKDIGKYCILQKKSLIKNPLRRNLLSTTTYHLNNSQRSTQNLSVCPQPTLPPTFPPTKKMQPPTKKILFDPFYRTFPPKSIPTSPPLSQGT